MIGNWWNTFQGWYVWEWKGWVAIGAIGTVLALIALGVQAFRLGQQLALERQARQQEMLVRHEDERIRRETLQRANTPYLSLEGALDRPSAQVGEKLYIFGLLHCDGIGVVHNVVCQISRTTPPESHMNTPAAIRYMRPNNDTMVQFDCDISNVQQLLVGPLIVQIDVSFLNQFDQRVQFTQRGSVEATAKRDNIIQGMRFTVTDAPKYTWPWDQPAT